MKTSIILKRQQEFQTTKWPKYQPISTTMYLKVNKIVTISVIAK